MMNGPNLLAQLYMWTVPGYWVLQIILLIVLKGPWRKKAMVPLILMIPILIYTALAYHADSNLWPVLMILVGPYAFIYLVIITIMRLVAKR